jgi:hypothetical protein
VIAARVRLEWVLYAERLRHVGSFVDIPIRDRPAVQCPECGRRVTLKLGGSRRHHAAHRPGDQCAAAHPESALHINVKCHIAAVLEGAIGGALPLLAKRFCSGTNAAWNTESGKVGPGDGLHSDCAESLDRVWVTSWDAVRLESGVGDGAVRRVPDVILEKNGVAVAAIEVLVSHAVDADKAQALASSGVPWIEVRATAALCNDPGWSIDQALPIHRASFDGNWLCDRHQLTYDIAADGQRLRQLREAQAPRYARVVTAARIVDVYRRGGWSERLVYEVEESTQDEELKTISLRRSGTLIASFVAEGESAAAFRARAAPLVKRAYDADVAELRRQRGVQTDSPMRWAKGAGAAILVGSPDRLPRRYRFDTRMQRWVLHDDGRGRRWDESRDDVNAASLAVAKIEQAIVRKRGSPQAALVSRSTSKD